MSKGADRGSREAGGTWCANISILLSISTATKHSSPLEAERATDLSGGPFVVRMKVVSVVLLPFSVCVF